MDLIAWLLSWFPGWSVTWLAGGAGIAGLAGFVWGRFPLLPNAKIAGLIGPLLILAAAFLAGVGSAQSVQEARALRAENEILKSRLATIEDLRAKDREQASRDAEANRQNQGRADDTPANDGMCLLRDAVGRVRGIR